MITSIGDVTCSAGRSSASRRRSTTERRTCPDPPTFLVSIPPPPAFGLVFPTILPYMGIPTILAACSADAHSDVYVLLTKQRVGATRPWRSMSRICSVGPVNLLRCLRSLQRPVHALGCRDDAPSMFRSRVRLYIEVRGDLTCAEGGALYVRRSPSVVPDECKSR